MISRLGTLITELKSCVTDLDSAALSGDAAMELFADFAEVERLGAAGKLMTAAGWRRPRCGGGADRAPPPTGWRATAGRTSNGPRTCWRRHSAWLTAKSLTASC